MRIDFEDATPRHNRIKIGTIVILVILFIGLFGLLGMYYAKLYNFNLFATLKDNYKEYIEETQKSDEIQEEQNNDLLLPKYTENSKQKMQKIYILPVFHPESNLLDLFLV